MTNNYAIKTTGYAALPILALASGCSTPQVDTPEQKASKHYDSLSQASEKVSLIQKLLLTEGYTATTQNGNTTSTETIIPGIAADGKISASEVPRIFKYKAQLEEIVNKLPPTNKRSETEKRVATDAEKAQKHIADYTKLLRDDENTKVYLIMHFPGVNYDRLLGYGIGKLIYVGTVNAVEKVIGTNALNDYLGKARTEQELLQITMNPEDEKIKDRIHAEHLIVSPEDLFKLLKAQFIVVDNKKDGIVKFHDNSQLLPISQLEEMAKNGVNAYVGIAIPQEVEIDSTD